MFSVCKTRLVHSYCRERASKASLLDGLEEGGLRASSSYSDVSDHDNEKAVQSLQDRVVFLKRVSVIWDYLFSDYRIVVLELSVQL